MSNTIANQDPRLPAAGGLHVIFGTGPLGRFTAEALLADDCAVRLISRSGAMESPPVGAEIIAADAMDPEQTAPLLAGATSVYQCAQPSYHRWPQEFPQLQAAILHAASRTGAKLIAAENLYLYGDPRGYPLVESLPYRPCSIKGAVRAKMAEELFAAHQSGMIRAASVRGSDFFGPWEPINGSMIFRAALAGKAVNLLGRLDQPHSFTYVKDFGRALATAGSDDRALGRAWHVPSGPALTQGQVVDLLAKELGRPVKAQAAGKLMLGLVGLFNPDAKELVEMLYEFNAPFVIDASDMERTFGLRATPMETGIRETLEWARSR